MLFPKANMVGNPAQFKPDTLYVSSFLFIAGMLLFLGRDQLPASESVTWLLAFGGTTVSAVLAAALYRVHLELKAHRRELIRKEAEMTFALEVQRALLPRRLPSRRGLEVTATCIPARGVSGDYYDILELPEDRLLFAIGDVTGKGVSAALLMANLQAALRMTAENCESLAKMCVTLNSHVYKVTAPPLFVTFFVAEWSSSNCRLRYVNAGHHPPFVIGFQKAHCLDQGGLPLGLFPDAVYEMGEVEFQPGDLLVLYSDGIVEADSASGEEFGTARLRGIIEAGREQSLEVIQNNVLEQLRRWAGNEPRDDVTLMMARAAEGNR